MSFTVRHLTEYRYSAPVRLGDHVLRLTPRGAGLRGLAHLLEVFPEPAERRDEVDGFGNRVVRLGFRGETDRLRIDSRFSLDNHAPGGVAEAVPAAALAPYLETVADPAVTEFSAAVAAQAGDEDFAGALAAEIHRRLGREIRDTGAAMTAAQTLAAGQGACRDLATLFIEACRARGLPARFVSGYQARSALETRRRYLHAWAEVYLPGLGWRAYDPTHGRAVAESHVALAVAPEQAGTMPVEGGFWGDNIGSTLTFELTIDTGA